MSSVSYDQDLYGDESGDRAGYSNTIIEEDTDERMDDAQVQKRGSRFSAPKDAYMKEVLDTEDDAPDELQRRSVQKRLTEREDAYKKQRLKRTLSPSRVDAFDTKGNKNGEARSYSEVMRETELERERERTLKEISEKHQQEASKHLEEIQKGREEDQKPTERKRRWDDQGSSSVANGSVPAKKSEWEEEEESKPKPAEQRKRSRWDETPVAGAGGMAAATPSRRSRWDQTPVGKTGMQLVLLNRHTFSFSNPLIKKEELMQLLSVALEWLLP
jgi:splicing factor 3B subunit 1